MVDSSKMLYQGTPIKNEVKCVVEILATYQEMRQACINKLIPRGRASFGTKKQH